MESVNFGDIASSLDGLNALYPANLLATEGCEGASMVALKTERRVFLWRVHPAPVPSESGKDVTLEEILQILEAEFAGKRARCYLSAGARLLEDDDANRDEKNQIYIAQIKRNAATNTVTLLINRGDPEAVSPAFLNTETNAVRVEHPQGKEAPGWSAHLVISTVAEKKKGHRACFEKMPHVSSHLVQAALDKIITRAIVGNAKYSYVVQVKDKKTGKPKPVTKSYRPLLGTKRVPSEKLENDLVTGELAGITLTKAKIFYNGVGAEKIIKRQEEKIVIRTGPADKGQTAALIKAVITKGKNEGFEAVSFDLENLPGNLTNRPTLSLDDKDALEQLYVRAQVIDGFKDFLEACYPAICAVIEEKMIALVTGAHGW